MTYVSRARPPWRIAHPRGAFASNARYGDTYYKLFDRDCAFRAFWHDEFDQLDLTWATLLREIETTGSITSGIGYEQRENTQGYPDPDERRMPSDVVRERAAALRRRTKSPRTWRHLRNDEWRDQERAEILARRKHTERWRDAAFMEIVRGKIAPWMEGNVIRDRTAK